MRAGRPEIITLLCVLHFISLVFSALVMADAVITRINAMGPLAIQLDLRILNTALLTTMVAASATGMWQGKKWGWHLGLLLYTYVAVRQVSYLTMGTPLEAVVGGALPAENASSQTQAFQAAGHVGRIAAYVAVLTYLLAGKRVARFFGLSTERIRSRARAMVIPFALSVAMVLLFRLAYLMAYTQ